MKVESLVQLFQSFNRRIWNNKPFTYLIVGLIICYTVMLRNYPEVYYKYLLDPVLLSIVLISIIIIASYNFQLGLMLIISLFALYYPRQFNKYLIEENVENFENTVSPIEKTDKNIIDDEPKSLKKSVSSKNISTNSTLSAKKDKTATSEDEEDQKSQEGDSDEEVSDKEDEEEGEAASDNEEDTKISAIKLESLNPSFYKKKTAESNSNNKNSKKSVSNKVVEKLTDVKKKDNKKTSNNKDEDHTFLGDVRSIMKDLDTGKNKMNASNAIKKINQLMYQKHRGYIQQIINDADDESEEDDSDDDFY